MGRSHMVAAASLATAGLCALSVASRHELPAVAALDSTLGSMVPGASVSGAAGAALSWMLPHAQNPLWAVLAVLALLVGSVWADADQPSSLAGRRVPLPGPHRGLTHTTWVTLLLLPLAVLDPTRLVAWFLVGSVSHNELDGLSVAGRVRFYPLARHKRLRRPGKDVIVSPRYGGLYTTGGAGERTLSRP